MMMMRMSFGTLKVVSLAFLLIIIDFNSLKTKKKSSQEAHSETAWTVYKMCNYFVAFIRCFGFAFREYFKH